MRHLLPLSVRGSNHDEPAFVIALFDIEGRLLRGSDTFSALLENRALTDDLLALPRSLTLRAACGYKPATSCPLTSRTICVGGRDFVLRGRFVESPAGADIAVALTLSAEPLEGRQDRPESPIERPRGLRRTRLPSRHVTLPLRRLRAPIELRR